MVNGRVIATSRTDRREFEPSTRSQPARVGEKVERATGLCGAIMSSPWKIPCTRFAIRLTLMDYVLITRECW